MNRPSYLRATSLVAGVSLLLIGYFAGHWHATILGRSMQTSGGTGHDLPEGHDSQHNHPEGEHSHDEHDEDHASLSLSLAAQKNLGLSEEYLLPVELEDYTKTVSIPGIIVDRPGRTKLPISASMTGLITHVHAVVGEAIRPGDLLIEIRLTHEDLITLQKEFLQSLGDRDVEIKEIARLEQASASGAISPKNVLDKQYSRDKLDSLIRSQREALRLHGLEENQLDWIERERKLLTEVQVVAGSPDDHEHEVSEDTDNTLKSDMPPLLIVQELRAQKGQIVNAGDLLCVLADYSNLLIEGQAFEVESDTIIQAKRNGWSVTAHFESSMANPVKNLPIRWVHHEIHPTSRTLKFFVDLPNTLRADQKSNDGSRFVDWEYRTGQRVQLQVPVELWKEQWVLPVEAVVREGLESYVFQQNGDEFLRKSVHERFRNSMQVVLENDGSIFPGDVIARRGAHQMNMALKNQKGPPVDPHAGHNH